MRVAVLGAGAVGARAARQLASTDVVERLVISDVDPAAAATAAEAIGEPGRVVAQPADAALTGIDVAILAVPAGTHRALAERLLEQGSDVVSVTDDVGEVRALLDLDAEARVRGRAVVVGAGFAPGLSCVLAAHGAATFDEVNERSEERRVGKECRLPVSAA